VYLAQSYPLKNFALFWLFVVKEQCYSSFRFQLARKSDFVEAPCDGQTPDFLMMLPGYFG
jgi:hypothetical protein